MRRAGLLLLWLALGLPGCLTQPPPAEREIVLGDAQKLQKINRIYNRAKAKMFPQVEDLTPSQAHTLMTNAKAVVVDVRTPQEREVSMIANAITKDEYESSREAYSDMLVIPYCTIGPRSGMYAKKLMERGIAVKNMRGAALGWAHEGLAFEQRGTPTKKVHVFGDAWSLLPEGYSAVR